MRRLIAMLVAFTAASSALAGPADLAAARLRLELAPLASKEVRERLSLLTEAPASEAGTRLYLTAVEILVRLEGPDAVAFVRQRPYPEVNPRALAEAMVRGLAARSCQEAEQWLATLPTDDGELDRGELTRVLLQTEAQRDASSALARGLRLAAGDLSSEINNSLAVIEHAAFRGEFEVAHQLAAGLENAPVRQAVLGNLAGLAADHRPDLAITWWRDLPEGEEKRSAVFRVLEGLANRDFTRALEFYAQLGDAEKSTDLLESTVARAHAIGPADFDQMLALAPPSDRDRVTLAALLRQGTVTPDAIAWHRFGTLSAARERTQLLVSLLRSHAQRDPGSAEKVVRTLDFLSETEREQLSAALRKKSRR